jgi:hypothetical protein
MAKEATYSLIRDNKDRICGLWLRSREDTEDRVAMTFLLTSNGADETVRRKILQGLYGVRPNDVDDKGGYFVLVLDDGLQSLIAPTSKDFVSRAVSGAQFVECGVEVTAAEVLHAYDEIGHGLKGLGMETHEVMNIRNLKFSLECMKCHGRINERVIETAHMIWCSRDGSPIVSVKQDPMMAALGVVQMVAEFEHGAPFRVNGPGIVLRFYMGQCPGECDGNRFVMRWHPPRLEGLSPNK